MPTLQLISDLHTEHYENPLAFLSEKIDPILHYHRPDFLVIAGDLVNFHDQSHEQVDAIFGYFAKRARHVLYVTGNHEYWYAGQGEAEFKLKGILHRHPNLHWLDNTVLELEGVRFIGGTMWFPYLEDTKWRYESVEEPWADFVEIKDFRKDYWPYAKNKEFTKLVNEQCRPGDVVITHYLPNHRSIADGFRSHDTNRFFLSDQTQAIFEREPRYWLHGHTHNQFDYVLNHTRVVCNPYGYHYKAQPVYSPILLEI